MQFFPMKIAIYVSHLIYIFCFVIFQNSWMYDHFILFYIVLEMEKALRFFISINQVLKNIHCTIIVFHRLLFTKDLQYKNFALFLSDNSVMLVSPPTMLVWVNIFHLLAGRVPGFLARHIPILGIRTGTFF